MIHPINTQMSIQRNFGTDRYNKRNDDFVKNSKAGFDQVNFTGFSFEEISPLNYYMRKVLNKFTFISKRRRFPVDESLKEHLKILKLKTGKTTCEAWDINPNNSDKYVIFYHGLGQNVTSNQEMYKSIIGKGYGVFAPEYGGFGESTGTITAQSIKTNTKAAIKYLKNKGIDEKNIGVVGFSMGSLPAIDLAHKNDNLKFLILISPFNSVKNESEMLSKGQSIKLPKILKYLIEKFPFLLKFVDSTFKNIQKMKNIKLPVYFIHSENDNIIPTKSTKELAGFSRNLKKFILLKNGGHSIEKNKIDAFNNLTDI